MYTDDLGKTNVNGKEGPRRGLQPFTQRTPPPPDQANASAQSTTAGRLYTRMDRMEERLTQLEELFDGLDTGTMVFTILQRQRETERAEATIRQEIERAKASMDDVIQRNSKQFRTQQDSMAKKMAFFLQAQEAMEETLDDLRRDMAKLDQVDATLTARFVQHDTAVQTALAECRALRRELEDSANPAQRQEAELAALQQQVRTLRTEHREHTLHTEAQHYSLTKGLTRLSAAVKRLRQRPNAPQDHAHSRGRSPASSSTSHRPRQRQRSTDGRQRGTQSPAQDLKVALADILSAASELSESAIILRASTLPQEPPPVTPAATEDTTTDIRTRIKDAQRVASARRRHFSAPPTICPREETATTATSTTLLPDYLPSTTQLQAWYAFPAPVDIRPTFVQPQPGAQQSTQDSWANQ